MQVKTMTKTRYALWCLMLVWLALPVPGRAADPIDGASAEQLRQWLKEYPQADANHDGVLAVEEARAYYQKLQRERLASPPSPQGTIRHEFTFATMSDGVKIALAVGYPKDFDPADRQRKWPAILRTCGYPCVTAPGDPGGVWPPLCHGPMPRSAGAGLRAASSVPGDRGPGRTATRLSRTGLSSSPGPTAEWAFTASRGRD